jgi:hypothetical protein
MARLENGFYTYPDKDCRDGVEHELSVGRYYTEGGCQFEFMVRWQSFDSNGEKKVYATLEISEDTWLYLDKLSGLFDEMRQFVKSKGGKDFGYTVRITLDEFIDILKRAGFKDMRELKAKKVA